MDDQLEQNRQISRAIARLFAVHPKMTNIDSDDLWEPPLTASDSHYAAKSQSSGATLRHLLEKGICEGKLLELNGQVSIKGASLTIAGYMLGHVSQEAVDTDDETLAALVARRVNGHR